MDLKDYIRDIPDFPEPGIIFKDITPLLANPEAFDHAVAQLAGKCGDADFDAIVAVESRGFIFGAPLARELGKPLVPVRKAGKLPADTHAVEYDLEYGSNVLEIHSDGIAPGQRALVIDDLLAIGGTLSAARTSRGGLWRRGCPPRSGHRAIFPAGSQSPEGARPGIPHTVLEEVRHGRPDNHRQRRHSSGA